MSLQKCPEISSYRVVDKEMKLHDKEISAKDTSGHLMSTSNDSFLGLSRPPREKISGRFKKWLEVESDQVTRTFQESINW